MDLNRNGKLLCDLRKAKGMTQKEVADELGILSKTVSTWETGHGFPDVSVLSALADIFSGYAVYAPITCVIKGVMALAFHFLFKLLQKNTGKTLSAIISGAISELLMITGYFLFEGFLYGFPLALANTPAGAIQGSISLIIGVILIKILKKRM